MKALRLLLAYLFLMAAIQPAQAGQALVVLPTQSSLTTAFINELQAALGTPVDVLTTATATLPPGLCSQEIQMNTWMIYNGSKSTSGHYSCTGWSVK